MVPDVWPIGDEDSEIQEEYSTKATDLTLATANN